MEKKKKVLNMPLNTKQSIVSKIVDQITEAIIRGEINPGEKLPTETELCQNLQVGRNSLREAIKILESYGVLHIKRADGTYISEQYHHKMLDPMLYGILLQKDGVEDIVELRKVLDIGMLMVASQKLEANQMSLIKQALEALKDEVQKENMDVDLLLEADIKFHMSIGEAIQNQLLINMYNYVDRITIPSRIYATKLIIEKNARDRFIQLHQKIVDLIEHHNVQSVNEVVNEHYMFWKQIKN